MFERAKRFLETTADLLPTIIFDEIGLAEISKNNPLKVLHSLLELENNTIGFIAISNWRLDASKMNRVLYLARPDPDEGELRMTALSIYESYRINDKSSKKMIEALSDSYFELKAFYNNYAPEYEDFYGLRDFYNMINQVSLSLAELKNIAEKQDLARIAKNSIERNFGGMLKAADLMGKLFMEKFRIADEYNDIPKAAAMDLIMQNLLDNNSRYLMIISNRELGSYIHHKILKNSLKSHRFKV